METGSGETMPAVKYLLYIYEYIKKKKSVFIFK